MISNAIALKNLYTKENLPLLSSAKKIFFSPLNISLGRDSPFETA